MNTYNTPQFSPPKENFAQEIRKQVYSYFQSRKLSKYGDNKLLSKALLLVGLFLLNYFLWIFADVNFWIKALMSISLGILTSLIGFNVMHDAAHHCFSQKKWLNTTAAYTLNLLGANVFLWKTKHNIVHHTYTNIPGVDADIDAGIFMYLNPTNKKYPIHRFQHLYFPFIYSLLYLYWVFYADYVKYFSKKVGPVEIAQFNIREKIIFWASKTFHLFAFVIVPMSVLGWKQWIILFLIYALTAGLILSIVFQLAHVVEETHFPTPDEKNTIQEEWMIHQLKTTSNFATNSKLLSYLLGGLNFQIEHHLFPTISHVHYPAISKIVHNVCKEFNIPYYAQPNFAIAIHSHYKKLKQLGRE